MQGRLTLGTWFLRGDVAMMSLKVGFGIPLCLWSYQERIDAGEYQSNQSDEVRAEFERDAWAYLIEYLMTLEAPDFLHEPG